jgi:hypothetical protein
MRRTPTAHVVKRNAYRILVEDSERKWEYGDLRIEWTKSKREDDIKLNLNKQDWVEWNEIDWLRTGTNEDSFESCTEASRSIRQYVLEQLSGLQLPKKGSATVEFLTS